MSRGRFLKFSYEPVGVLFGHVGDGEGEDGGIGVRMNFEYFFFYFLVMLLDGFAKQDNFVGFFYIALPRRPEVKRAHAGNNIDTSREAFFKEMPPDILRLFPRLTRDVDEDHCGHEIIISARFLF